MPLDFTGQDLRGRSFRGQDLRGTCFQGADIRRANFARADLTGANFVGTWCGLTWHTVLGQLLIGMFWSVLLALPAASIAALIAPPFGWSFLLAFAALAFYTEQAKALSKLDTIVEVIAEPDNPQKKTPTQLALAVPDGVLTRATNAAKLLQLVIPLLPF